MIRAVFLDGLEDDVISGVTVCGEGPSILLKMESGVDLGQSPEGPFPGGLFPCGHEHPGW